MVVVVVVADIVRAGGRQGNLVSCRRLQERERMRVGRGDPHACATGCC
jgi:hypothetical protein